MTVETRVTIDELDKRILDEVQRDASRSMHELASCVGSTPSTCHRRYRRLVARRVIEKTIAVVNAASSNEAISVLAGFVIESQRPADQARFQQFLKKDRRVKMAWMTTGEFDYMILGAFADMEAYKIFVEEELSNAADIKNFRTFAAIKEVKLDVSRRFA